MAEPIVRDNTTLCRLYKRDVPECDYIINKHDAVVEAESIALHAH